MSVAKNLLLVAIDARTGRVRVVTRTVEAALGGAALIDLVLLGRLRLEGSGRKARVEVVDRTPVPDPALQQAFERVREQGRQTPKSTIARLGRRQRAVVLRDMEAAGTIRRQRRLVLERYDVADVVQRDDLVGRLRPHPSDPDRSAHCRPDRRSTRLHQDPVPRRLSARPDHRPTPSRHSCHRNRSRQ